VNEDILKSSGGNFRLCELGKIKIGGKGESRPKAGGGTYRIPKKDDHFTLTTMNRNQAGDLEVDKKLMEELLATYADKDGKLRRIPIRVLSNDIEDILQSSWCWYSGKTCGARSDGREVTWTNDPKTGRRLDTPKTEPWKDEFLDYADSRGNKLFKLHFIFSCVIAAKESRWGGVFKFRSTSRISFNQIYASLIHLSQLTGGILQRMPLMLVVRPIQVSPEGKATTVYVVHVELPGGDMGEVQRIAMEQARWQIEFKAEMQKNQKQLRLLLAPPGTEPEGEAQDITEEFHPEAIVPEAAPDHDPIIDGEIVEPEATPAENLDDVNAQVPEPEVPEVEEAIDEQPRAVRLPDPCPESWIADWATTKSKLPLIEVKRQLKLKLSKPWAKLSRNEQVSIFDGITAGTFKWDAPVSA
jgi:hypothetical protein